ncbi:MAG TPA: type II secretion system protein, partial [Polyangium sp.]|nr:type II secretion system protein [Polyangium sp.]
MRETILSIRKRQRFASRGVTLVEVLIVLAIMAIIAGGAVALVFPQLKKARVKQAVLSAGVIKTTAEAYRQIDNASSDG